MLAIFPELHHSAREKNIELLAVQFRRYFGGAEARAPRPNIIAMARRAGLEVDHRTALGRGNLLAKDEHGRFRVVIVLHPDLEALEERFLVAHLIGHYLLEVQPLVAQGDWQVAGFRDHDSPMQRYEQGGGVLVKGDDEARERRADGFAAALLMPLGMVRHAAAKLGTEARVAQAFGVTDAVVRRRLADIQASLPERPRNFIAAAASIGQRPLSDLEVEATRDRNEQELKAKIGERTSGQAPRAVVAASYKNAPAAPSAPVASNQLDEGPLGMAASGLPKPPPRKVAERRAAAKLREQAASDDAPAEPSQARNPPSPAKAVAAPDLAMSPKLKGMERLRELARRLEAGRQKV